MRQEAERLVLLAQPELLDHSARVRCLYCAHPDFGWYQNGKGETLKCPDPHCKDAYVEDAARIILADMAKVKGRKGGAVLADDGEVTENVTTVEEEAEDPYFAYFAGPAENLPPAELAAEAYYGLPGDVVRVIDPHTEAAKVAVLGSFLAEAGCLVGKGPHIFRDGMRHTCNEFLALVGPSGVGRKGSASRRSHEIIRSVDCNWTAERCARGLSSGEGLIYAVRDPTSKDEGVVDKRLMVIEEEFAQILKVMNREGNTLSIVIRSAWDNAPLAVTTKNSPLKATETHISILAHITDTELRRLLTQTEKANGFANRFVWLYSERSKFLPHGGGKTASAEVVRRFHDTLDYIRRVGEVEFDDDAKSVWEALYRDLTTRPPGLLGAVTSRAEAHVVRLSLLYALLDASKAIQVPHLLAALAVWDYSERTCLYIFGDATGDDMADTIESALRDAYPGTLTATEISAKFNRHAKAGDIKKALHLLFTGGRATVKKIKTQGRPEYHWTAVFSRRCEISELSPFEKARDLAQKMGY